MSANALRLFDLTWPRHGLSRECRRLLHLGATVHDVGRCIDDDTHPQQGAMMLLQDGKLPLSPSERRSLAYLTLYHRGKVPGAGCDSILRRGDDHDAMIKLLAMLRCADSLDSRVAETPRIVLKMEDRQLSVTCVLEEDTAKARKIYTRRKKHRLLEDVLDVKVDVRLRFETGIVRQAA